MAKQRKLTYRGHKEYDEVDRCFWCGGMTDSREHIVNPGGDPVIKCCGQACYDRAMAFIERDTRARKLFWIALFVCCVLNLVALGFGFQGFLGYAPLFALAVVVFIWPSLFTRYASYTRFGFVKTRRAFRILAVLVGLLAVGSAFATMRG